MLAIKSEYLKHVVPFGARHQQGGIDEPCGDAAVGCQNPDPTVLHRASRRDGRRDPVAAVGTALSDLRAFGSVVGTLIDADATQD